MVKVQGSKGSKVFVEFEGINQVVNRLQADMKKILNASEFELAQAGNFVQNEVQESIIGNRAEPKSVSSGKLGNSIDVKIDKGFFRDSVIIFSRPERYPQSNTTTQEVANILEYGTSKGLTERRHFRNTRARVESRIVNDFKDIVKLAIK